MSSAAPGSSALAVTTRAGATSGCDDKSGTTDGETPVLCPPEPVVDEDAAAGSGGAGVERG
eukprot:3418365-Rhodomonas_salina.1